MKIYSMTATFGKLSHETLTLQPGLNIVEAPNEWGKSTWCAFMAAMLYGINTREQTKTGFLADKEHYTPWSGAPMSGRMDLCWNGRDITIERRNKGRGYFNDFKAYETQSGLPVEELTAANCGQTLLGVEQSVFVRAGFLRQSDLPVTADDALRRRLNALVTTGDESGTSDDLAQKLKDLKNRCRFNKKGLLPEAEAERDALEGKLQQIEALQYQKDTIIQRQQQVKGQIADYENHLTALTYQENQAYGEKLAAAKVARDQAEAAWKQSQADSAQLPDEKKILEDLDNLQQLRQKREDLLLAAQMLPPAPEAPVVETVFRGKDPGQAQEDARADYQKLQGLLKNTKTPAAIFIGAVPIVAGLLLAIIAPGMALKTLGAALILAGVVVLIRGIQRTNDLKAQIETLRAAYRGIPENQWVEAAAAYGESQSSYTQSVSQRQLKLETINRELEEIGQKVQDITGGLPQSRYEQELSAARQQKQKTEELQRQYQQAEQFLQSLQTVQKEVLPPSRPDPLTDSREQTERQLTALRLEEQQLHQRLGQCQGQMDALGSPEAIGEQLQQLKARIAKLERVQEAVIYAMQVQQDATQELQRRFAHRISQRARELMGRLTSGRYDRLSLDQDLQLYAAAQGEDTLRSNLWRSSGTGDQLYLALRLAVAEELTPEAPLVLDDALVRFDDARLGAALEVLKESHKQVILFTCQSREKAWEEANKE